MKMEIIGPNFISQGEKQARYWNFVPLFSNVWKNEQIWLKLLLWNIK